MIEEKGGHSLVVRCDVTRVEDVKAALDRTAKTLGTWISRSITLASIRKNGS